MFRNSVRLGLEKLDARNAPSVIGGNDVATTEWMPPADGPTSFQSREYGDAKNKKPSIINFTVVVGANNQATFSGTVVDENPAGLTVTLTGVQACLGNGVTVTTDANGNFTFTGTVTPGVDAGNAYANVSDAEGQAAPTATFYLFV